MPRPLLAKCRVSSFHLHGMLSPPDAHRSAVSRDKGALEEAGKERYLNSLEKRLSKLEGGPRKQLTSKDILQSLSEARDDHIMQHSRTGSEFAPGRNGPSLSSRGSTGSGRESPYSIRNEFADVDLGGGIGDVERGGSVRWEGRGVAEGGEDRPVTSNSVWTCCLNCRGGSRHRGYSRAQRGGDDTGQEGSRLVDCDELSLEWQSQDINDIT